MKERKFIPTFESAFITKTHTWDSINEAAISEANTDKKVTHIAILPCDNIFYDYSVVDGVIDDVKERVIDTAGEGSEVDESKTDYRKITDMIAKWLCDEKIPSFIKEELRVNVNFTFDKLVTRGNGINDIQVKITYTPADIIRLMKENESVLKPAIKKAHTSTDGYISFISNKIEDWFEVIENNKAQEGKQEKIGNMASFVLEVLMKEHGFNDDNDMFYTLDEKFSDKIYDMIEIEEKED